MPTLLPSAPGCRYNQSEGMSCPGIFDCGLTGIGVGFRRGVGAGIFVLFAFFRSCLSGAWGLSGPLRRQDFSGARDDRCLGPQWPFKEAELSAETSPVSAEGGCWDQPRSQHLCSGLPFWLKPAFLIVADCLICLRDLSTDIVEG